MTPFVCIPSQAILTFSAATPPGAGPCHVNFGGHGSTLVFPCFVLFLSQQLKASSHTQGTVAFLVIASTWSRAQISW